MSTRILQPIARRHQAPLVQHLPKEVRHQFGRGLGYPWAVRNNQWETAEGEEKIQVSIFVILSTPLGSRYGQPDFGSMLPLLVFANYDSIMKAELKRYSAEAIRRWEPRIQLQQVILNDANAAENAIDIAVSYILKNASSGPQTATIPVKLENNSLRFQNPGKFTLHGQRVF